MPLPKPKPKTIFLSHASADKELVDALSDLLTTGCGVPGHHIISTSLPGQGIPAGVPNYIEWIKDKLTDSELVILLLSPNYFESKFCVCEMGAAWGLNLPWFPLIVPPLKSSEVRAVMAVTQNLSIEPESCLDELRDKVSELIDSNVPTAKWNVKRDTFLGKLPGILKNLPQPDKVDRSVLQAAEAKYAASQDDISEKEDQIAKLKEQIVDLENCTTKAEAKAVRAKHSSLEGQFDALVSAASSALTDLHTSTCDLLFHERGGEGDPEMDEEWHADASTAASIQEISTKDGYSVNTEHIRVRKAQDALDELDNFIRRLPDEKFEEDFEEEHNFPLSLKNKEFWDFVYRS